MANKFNLTRFNLEIRNKFVDFSATAEFEVSGIIGFDTEIKFDSSAFQVVNSMASMVRRGLFRALAAESLESRVSLERFVFIGKPAFNSIDSKTETAKNIYIVNAAENEVKTRSAAGKNVYLYSTAAGKINTETDCFKNFVLHSDANNVIISLTNIEDIIRKVMTLDVNLKPGQTITIDSNDFNVFIDNENAIETHRGTWVFLNRNILDLNLQASNAEKIDGKIVYTERYL